MREPNHNFPAQNRACVCITSQLYDRRALDGPVSTLPLVTSLTHLAYLTSTSPRIREILTLDGGLERLSAIVRNCLVAVARAKQDALGIIDPPAASQSGSSTYPEPVAGPSSESSFSAAASSRRLVATGGPFRSFASYCGSVANSNRVKGKQAEQVSDPFPERGAEPDPSLPIILHGGASRLPNFPNNVSANNAAASVPVRRSQINVVSGKSAMQGHALYKRALLVTYALALQSLVNVGVRGTESIRTRVVEAGILDVVALVLAGYLEEREASQAALRKSFGKTRDAASTKRSSGTARPSGLSQQVQLAQPPSHSQEQQTDPQSASVIQARREERFMTARNNPRLAVAQISNANPTTGTRPGQSTDPNALPRPIAIPGALRALQSSANPRDAAASASAGRITFSAANDPVASTSAISIDTDMSTLPSRRETPAPLQPSSLPSSFAPSPVSASEDALGVVPSLSQPSSLAPSRVGTPDYRRPVVVPTATEETIETEPDPTTGSSEDGEAEPLAEDVVMQAVSSTISGRQVASNDTASVKSGDGDPPADNANASSMDVDEENAVASAQPLAAASISTVPEPSVQGLNGQHDMDIEDAVSERTIQTRRNSASAATPAATSMDIAQRTVRPAAPAVEPAPARDATIAPLPQGQDRTHRHHHHHNTGTRNSAPPIEASSSNVGEGYRFRDEDVLLCLQLLAYLSKYPHIRAVFHDPSIDYACSSILTSHEPPAAPATKTNNVFLLVERYTIRPTSSTSHDRTALRLNPEITYWAGTIMRNACRKDDNRGGIRQCASMTCGAWETYPREFAKCRRCRKARYCSKECQSKAWSGGHRFWCSARDHDNTTDARDLAVLRNLPSSEQALVQRYIEQYPYLATAPDALNELIRRLRYANSRNTRRDARQGTIDSFTPEEPEIRPVVPPTFNEDEGPEDENAADLDEQDDGGIVIADEGSDQTRDLLRVAEDADVFG